MCSHKQRRLDKRIQRLEYKDKRIEVWREQPLEEAVATNPYDSFEDSQPHHVPEEPELNYFPDGHREFGTSKQQVRIDPIESNPDISRPANIRLAHALDCLDAFQKTTDLDTLNKAGCYFVEAARMYWNEGDYNRALRAFLNTRRTGLRTGVVIAQSAMCIAEMGNRRTAAIEYIHAAEQLRNEGTSPVYQRGILGAAEAFESAGLLLAIPVGNQAEPIITNNGIYNSAACYREAKSLFSSQGDFESASRCMVLELDTQKRTHPHRKRRVMLEIMRCLWLYGESPLRAIVLCIVVWIVCALMFLLFGFNVGKEIVNYDLAYAWEFDICHLGDALYFSAMTLSTVGYGDCSPASGLSKLVAGAEGLSGVVLMAMLLVTIQRRFIGR